jgi:hypothetical protein
MMERGRREGPRGNTDSKEEPDSEWVGGSGWEQESSGQPEATGVESAVASDAQGLAWPESPGLGLA